MSNEWICGHCGKGKSTELGLCPHCLRFPTKNALSVGNLAQAMEALDQMRKEDASVPDKHSRHQNSDVIFVRGVNNPDNGYLRFINTKGRTMSLSGPAIDHNTVAQDEQHHLFHRIEVGFWNYDGSGCHCHPASTAEEILEVLAHHLGYKVVKEK
jgi:hypothetical protein